MFRNNNLTIHLFVHVLCHDLYRKQSSRLITEKLLWNLKTCTILDKKAIIYYVKLAIEITELTLKPHTISVFFAHS